MKYKNKETKELKIANRYDTLFKCKSIRCNGWLGPLDVKWEGA